MNDDDEEDEQKEEEEEEDEEGGGGGKRRKSRMNYNGNGNDFLLIDNADNLKCLLTQSNVLMLFKMLSKH